jgi:hypothetical protein
MTAKSPLTVQVRTATGLGMLAIAPLICAGGLLSAAPAAANPSMCAVAPSVYQTSGACVLPGTAQQKPHSPPSSLLQANQIDPATAGTNDSMPQVSGIPCTGVNTDTCIGPTPGA